MKFLTVLAFAVMTLSAVISKASSQHFTSGISGINGANGHLAVQTPPNTLVAIRELFVLRTRITVVFTEFIGKFIQLRTLYFKYLNTLIELQLRNNIGNHAAQCAEISGHLTKLRADGEVLFTHYLAHIAELRTGILSHLTVLIQFYSRNGNQSVHGLQLLVRLIELRANVIHIFSEYTRFVVEMKAEFNNHITILLEHYQRCTRGGMETYLQLIEIRATVTRLCAIFWRRSIHMRLDLYRILSVIMEYYVGPNQYTGRNFADWWQHLNNLPISTY